MSVVEISPGIVKSGDWTAHSSHGNLDCYKSSQSQPPFSQLLLCHRLTTGCVLRIHTPSCTACSVYTKSQDLFIP